MQWSEMEDGEEEGEEEDMAEKKNLAQDTILE